MKDCSIRILLIEDNPGDARLVKEMLAEGDQGSFHLSHVERLTEGLARLKEDDFQVVLLDLSLPDAQGLDTVTQVCTQAPHIPVLVFTGCDDETLAIRAVQVGAQDYLVKGQMDYHLLKKSIRYALERKRAEEGMRALEEQLRQSQKIEAIGQLAGGFAHDFNNSLTLIKTCTQLTLLELKENDPLREKIEMINDATDRSANLSRHLLAFSRRQVMEMKVLDLNALLRDLDKMLRRVIGEDIELVYEYAQDLGRVKVDPGQIEQVILNLVINARDAMPKGGKLIIETSDIELDEKYFRAHVSGVPGRYVLLSVSDTGVGMTREVRERVFEPFFTTKEKAKGTGLGLSTAYGIVKQSGGYIWVYSEPGMGSTFKIYLPHVEGPIDVEKGRQLAHGSPGGGETILVVEDEKDVRLLVGKVLKKQGYKVLEASNGGEALLICEEHKDPIHLMVTDVVMPGMSGPKLAERLHLVHPEMKVLHMSGYAHDVITHHGILEKGINFIQKPFSIEKLSEKLCEVLNN
jgi:two-component system cell cycle sensor histidine kinase/response regulator CckA